MNNEKDTINNLDKSWIDINPDEGIKVYLNESILRYIFEQKTKNIAGKVRVGKWRQFFPWLPRGKSKANRKTNIVFFKGHNLYFEFYNIWVNQLDLERNFHLKLLLEGFNFSSYYKEIPIIKSIIYPDGKIEHQINKHYLTNPQLLEKIKIVHFCCLENLLIAGKYRKVNFNIFLQYWLSFVIALGLVLITVIIHLDKFINNIWLWLFVPIVFWVLHWGIRRLQSFYRKRFKVDKG